MEVKDKIFSIFGYSVALGHGYIFGIVVNKIKHNMRTV